MKRPPDPLGGGERDLRLGAVLRAGGAEVPDHEVDFDGMARRIASRARAQVAAAEDWSLALPRWLPAIAASLFIMASAAVIGGEMAWSDHVALAPVAAERLVLARIVSSVRDEETFGLLFNAARADLFEYKSEQ
ncbi:MAG TPA: hypothetical protein VMJ30_04490 [Gemmatimonadales bacterium]|nr:hypothetical protein [Gemmatimonadales bacterium]